ncbi:MAG: 4Fe-4S cluster-binding domain-containing protein [Clostridia bacterium]|nr:4Fe-4S cluster-binding domain-containing protein [Clostridia bacterium]
MIVKGILDEDFVNYKEPSMFIAFPRCNWKCERECGRKICQNSLLAASPDIEVSYEEIYNRFIENNITSSIVCGGLEPLDTLNDLLGLIDYFRNKGNNSTFVIYTGYTEEEAYDDILLLAKNKNIIIKFGRFVPNREPHFDKVLGINLASDNQYAKTY